MDAGTEVLARELGPKKIRVNSINPGIVETEGVHAGGFIGSDFQKQIKVQTPLGRIAQPEDITTIAVFLASADSRWLTRETVLASGGLRLERSVEAFGCRQDELLATGALLYENDSRGNPLFSRVPDVADPQLVADRAVIVNDTASSRSRRRPVPCSC